MKPLISSALALLALPTFVTHAQSESVPPPESILAIPEAPLPFGVGFYYFAQDQEYDVTGLRASLASGFPVPGFGSNAITKIENRVDQFNFKADWWVLPWLNIHAIVGGGSGEAKATLNPLIRPLLGNIKVGYDTFVYGGGITLAAGYQNFFVSLTADYTWGNVAMEDGGGLVLDDPTGIETLIVTPKIGYRTEKYAMWVGAYYQHTDHTQSGSFTLPVIGNVDFAADVQDSSPWIVIFGGEYYFDEHWGLTAEFGLANERHQAIMGLTYRF